MDIIFEAAEPNSTYKKRNDEMNLAWQFIASTGVSVFLTGKAGTGKTTFLRRICELSPKRMVVLAPTGVAAINAGGQTIHSFFQLPFGPYIPGQQKEGNNRFKMSQQKKDLIRTLDLLIIDEVSMVRADLLDQIDDAMRRYRDGSKPFGGVQLLLIGDLMQLSPVAKPEEWALLQNIYDTPYFFSSRTLKQLPYVTVELKHIYRQQDDEFINLLGSVRRGVLTPDVIEKLNKRYIPGFQEDGRQWIRLTTHNAPANQYNEQKLQQLRSPERTFSAKVEGDFPELSYPNDSQLTLKVGAQVMFVKNDPSLAHEYYNGKIGTVTAFTDEGVEVKCEGEEKKILVTPVEWENNKYELNPVTKAIEEKVVGTYSQIPLRLAWAITVHKSQGLTFDHAVLDVNAAFTHGQVYVALSRCRTLEGMVLSSPFASHAVSTDHTVNNYIESELSKVDENARQLPSYIHQYTLSLIDELYSFVMIDKDLQWLKRVVDEHLSLYQPALLNALKSAYIALADKVLSVAARFRLQYSQMMEQSAGKVAGTMVEQRIKDSSAYFAAQLTDIFDNVWPKLSINIENKATAEVYKNAVSALRQSAGCKIKLLEYFKDNAFSTKAYLEEKARIMLTLGVSAPASRATNRKEKPKKPAKAQKEYPEKKPKKKEPKVTTIEITKALYLQGHTPKQIAEIRGLTESTIYSHLAALVDRKDIPIEGLVSPDRQRRIEAVLKSFDAGYSMSEAREKLGEEYSYGEIKLVAAQLNK